MKPIMAIFHRYFTQTHLHPGMKGDTNLAGGTEKDSAILRVFQECGSMNLRERHAHTCQRPDAAWQSFQVSKSYTPPRYRAESPGTGENLIRLNICGR